MSFKGKTIVITGATSGMGLVTAKDFLALGAKVVLSGRNQEKLDALKDDLTGDFLLVKADASSIKESRTLIEKAVDHFGGIDALFINAGIFAAQPVATYEENLYDSIFDINTIGAFFTAQAAIPHLNQGSNIIFNTSVTNVKGMPGVSAYAASKAALRSFVRTLATELAPRQIRVNAVSPGPIETPIWGKSNLTEQEMTGFSAGISQQVPLGRFGKSEEVSQAVQFLASEGASFITGIELAVDGGMTQV